MKDRTAIISQPVASDRHTRHIASSANVDLVTCDRPMFFNTDLNKPGCLVMVPVSPDKVFFACNDRARLDAVEGCSANTLARSCNQDIVLLADKWVYGEAKDNFIANWLLKKAAGSHKRRKPQRTIRTGFRR